MQIEIEESGNENEHCQNLQSLYQDFVELIKLRKLVSIESLALIFNISQQDVVQRISSLLESQTIEGVFDDRGKFLVIS